jgi:hypothetical protein
MKKFIFPLFIIVFIATNSSLLAFGSAPFRNGSPLATGTDGAYQAVATGTNLTGILSWTIEGGMQPDTQRNNGWVFFIDGNVVNGSTVANISNGKVTGILDPGGDLNLPTNATGALQLPYATMIPDTSAQGKFSGKIDLKSPTAAFSGTGEMEGTPARSYQFLYVDEPEPLDAGSIPPFIPPVYEDINAVTGVNNGLPVINVNASTIPETQFTFRGTRLAIPVAAATAEE